MNRVSIGLIFLTLVSGCSTKVPAPYSVTMLDDNIYTVSVSSRIASSSALNKYLLSKAARAAESIGCSYFFAVGNGEQNYTVSNSNKKIGNNLASNESNIYETDSGLKYKVIKPGSRENTFVCTTNKPNTLLPGLYFKASLIPDYKVETRTNGFYPKFL
ncbi:hypothetical protein AAAA28_13125 [Providencia stuartii]|uniref:hypothetical protein n=1 Tax=Providencia stuartii TaxID=588 RepID=UPI0030F142DC